MFIPLAERFSVLLAGGLTCWRAGLGEGRGCRDLCSLGFWVGVAVGSFLQGMRKHQQVLCCMS